MTGPVGRRNPSQWKWSTIREALRWRGPLVCFMLALREMLRPLVYWHEYYIFETDLTRQHIPQPCAKQKCNVKVYSGAEDCLIPKLEIVSMGQLEPAEIDFRFNRGDMVAIAYAGNEPLGYEWLSFTNGTVELAFGITWAVGPGEAIRYDKFVLPKWRGRRISTWLHSAIVVCAHNHGTDRTFSSISTVNTQSLSIARHYRRIPAMKVTLIRVNGSNRIFQKAVGASFDSRFLMPT
jgi:GNAT superfamily N-acetyltransferase